MVATGVFASPGSGYARVLSHAVPRHLGHLSYSLFCIHLSVLSLVMTLTGFRLFTGHGATIWVLTAALSLLAAEALYQWVERPVARMRDRRGPPRSGGQAQSAAETTTTTR